MDDMHCAVCGADVFGPDTPSVSVVEWVPQQNANVLRAVFCMNPVCLRDWAIQIWRGNLEQKRKTKTKDN